MRAPRGWWRSAGLLPVFEESVRGIGLGVAPPPRPVDRGLPEGAGHLPHMDGHRTAAGADVIDAGCMGFGRERAHDLARKDEGFRLVRELLRRGEVRDPWRRAVRGRLTRDESG